MGYKTSLIVGPDGSTQSHIHSLMGCFALASTKQRAMIRLKSAIPEYFRWLRFHREDVAIPTKPRLLVVQELRIRGNPGMREVLILSSAVTEYQPREKT